MQPLPPKFHAPINFHAQHAPMGAFMSFTCGHFGSPGGIGVEIGKPANHSLYIGVKHGARGSSAPLTCLPFFKGAAVNAAANYQVEQASTGPITTAPGIRPYAAADISRHYGWATDAWVTPDLTFALHTPFDSIPDPETASAESLRAALLPAVTGSLTVDNRNGTETKTLFFAIDFAEPGARILDGDEASATTVGFAWRRKMGVLARADKGRPFPLQRWSIAEALSTANPVHALGTIAGVALEVPPGESRTLTLAIGVYLDGIVTTGLETSYFYTRHYASLTDVLSTALAGAPELARKAGRLDHRLAASGLSADQQFLIAHSTRSYYGSTQLLDLAGQPMWVVNEGEYCMMNTLDLSVDQMFWELERNPWVVRNLLDLFAHRYSYADGLGLSLTHDMGVNNNFSPAGHSSYELAHLTGCFSYMTAEQLTNYILMAATFVAKTEEGPKWARKNRHLIDALGQSLLARCARGGENTGVIQHDSSRCLGGAEITTYDSLDHSLAQTRNNLYMAVKCWASFLGLQKLVRAAGESSWNTQWLTHAHSAASTVLRHAGKDGILPAVFEPENPGHASRILPAAEGLIYPMLWGDAETAKEFAPLYATLKRHTVALLEGGQNVFPDGGIKLSSTSNNSWMSKIALFQHIARGVFGLYDETKLAALFAKADAAHALWQIIGSATQACSDQFVSGEAKGSRYYPRIITTALWLDPVPAAGARSREAARV